MIVIVIVIGIGIVAVIVVAIVIVIVIVVVAASLYAPHRLMHRAELVMLLRVRFTPCCFCSPTDYLLSKTDVHCLRRLI